MPANLTPQYYEAEKNFKAARSPLEKIAALEEMLAVMPKHKGTDHLRADLRTKIAKLTQSLDKRTATQRASMTIEKVGAGQVLVVGLPNAGKSQIVSSLTSAAPAVGAYPFTTHSAMPGMMEFENIQIQLVDTPPLAGPPEWWLANLIRRADALLLVVDLGDDPLYQLENLIAYLQGARLGLVGLEYAGDADILIRKKALVAANKADLDEKGASLATLRAKYGGTLPLAPLSAVQGAGLEDLKLQIYRTLDIIRVYTKTPGQQADSTDPIILASGSTLGEAAAAVHKEFAAKLKYARLWGSGKHDGIMVRRDHVLADGDVVELHK